MPGQTKTWSLADLHCVYKGVLITGGQDDFVTVEYNEPLYELVRGGDGRDFTRVRKNDDSAKVTFNLKQASAANDAFSADVVADKLGAGGGDLAISDLLGTTKLNASFAWIAERPSTAFQASVSDRKWVLETASLIGNIGGQL